jgi:hypothetical protein
VEVPFCRTIRIRRRRHRNSYGPAGSRHLLAKPNYPVICRRKIPPFDACLVSWTATEGPGLVKSPSGRRPINHGEERKFAAPFNAESRFRWRFCPWFASA